VVIAVAVGVLAGMTSVNATTRSNVDSVFVAEKKFRNNEISTNVYAQKMKNSGATLKQMNAGIAEQACRIGHEKFWDSEKVRLANKNRGLNLQAGVSPCYATNSEPTSDNEQD
jgi:hypothetical protein